MMMLYRPVVVIGCFDGMHKGHQGILEYAVKVSANKPIFFLTFNPDPGIFFSQSKTNFSIMNLYQKLDFVQKHFPQINMVSTIIFDQYFATLSAERFINEILIHNLNVDTIVVGHDFNFGHKCQGNIELLRKMLGYFNTEIVNDFHSLNNIKYSSTKIRNLIRNGDIKNANAMLGHTWEIVGKVVFGKKRGLKYLTANVNIGSYVWPKFGVYAVQVIIDNNNIQLPGIVNFGISPTFELEHIPQLSVHILNGFNQNIYDKPLQIKFIDFIREEHKFDNQCLLEKQIEQDCQYALNALK